MEDGLGVGRTELEIGDNIRLTDPDGVSIEVRCGANRLAMNREMTGNGSRTLGHWTHPTLQKY
ncbi:MAG: hypothetical protein A4E19_03200 [Nitrospira sp. SG-bin1]|nr:MAG: hypothetical protein A4E19_03200 [Nitrospira sp. SG-bin1]